MSVPFPWRTPARNSPSYTVPLVNLSVPAPSGLPSSLRSPSYCAVFCAALAKPPPPVAAAAFGFFEAFMRPARAFIVMRW